MPPIRSVVFCPRCLRHLPRESFPVRSLSDGRPNGIKGVCAECLPGMIERRRTKALAGIANRFWLKVDRSGGSDACWPFFGGRTKERGGYGRFSIPGRGPIGAHRVARELTNGPIPDGFDVCHRCDNPPCCNPAHLFLGTDIENNADRHAKGRTRTGTTVGERHHAARLTEAGVLAIRVSDEPARVLATRYGVSETQIQRIRRGDGWAHIHSATSQPTA